MMGMIPGIRQVATLGREVLMPYIVGVRTQSGEPVSLGYDPMDPRLTASTAPNKRLKSNLSA
jgi:hypothetical protein